MNDQIPAKVRKAIRAELDADAADYRDHVPEGEWVAPNNGQRLCGDDVIPTEAPAVDRAEAE